MKLLLTGARGQVGTELMRALPRLGDVVSFDRASLDIEDPRAVEAAVAAARPDVIVNAAAYTAVDLAESEPQRANAVNVVGPLYLAEAARRFGALLVHYSTDYVFDGAKQGSYCETDQPSPVNVYGASKLAGERAVMATAPRHLVLRTSWVYAPHGRNFVRTVLRLANQATELRIVADQFGAPTYARDLAAATTTAIATAMHRDVSGLFHITNRGLTTWYGLACAVLDRAGIERRVVPISTAAYPLPARRPRNSLLDTQRAERELGVSLPDWASSLRACVAKLGAARTSAIGALRES